MNWSIIGFDYKELYISSTQSTIEKVYMFQMNNYLLDNVLYTFRRLIIFYLKHHATLIHFTPINWTIGFITKNCPLIPRKVLIKKETMRQCAVGRDGVEMSDWDD